MMNETANPAQVCGAADSPGDKPAGDDIPGAAPGKSLSPEAIRALQEAEARRRTAPTADLPEEFDGRGGEEPTRYGDWERKGLAVDF